MLGEDDSLGEEAADRVVEDLKFDLQVLNAAMKKLDADWDFTATITPLLSDQGHALAVAAKLKRQIERMTKLRDEFQTKQAEQMPVLPDKPAGKCRRANPMFKRMGQRLLGLSRDTQPRDVVRTHRGRRRDHRSVQSLHQGRRQRHDYRAWTMGP